jgi:signal transduction histidine kinase
MQQAFAQSRRRARHLKIGIAASGVVLMLVLWTVVATSVLFARQAALQRAQSDGANLTAAFANEARHLLDSVSAAMEFITTKMHVEGETLDLQAWVKMIPLMTTPGIKSVFIGPDGKLVSASLDPHSKPIDLSDREHFRVHLDGSFKGLYIGRPIVGRISLQPAIPVSKRVETNDGRFLGVLLFMLAPSDFTTLYSSVDLGKRGVIALQGLDGVTRVRFSQSTPDGVVGLGVSVAGGPRPSMMSEGAQGGFVRESVIDHVTRFYSYRRVPQYPLVVTVGVDLDDALAAPNAQARLVISVAAASTLLLGGLAVFLVRQLQRQERADAARQELEGQLHHSQRLESLGILAGGIAHDLNNTLVPVLALTKIAARRAPEGSRERANLEIVHRASERARDLVKQILAFSRNEGIEMQPVSLTDIVRESVGILRASIPATIHIVTAIADVPSVLGNSGQLHQIVLNLVTNAAQAIGGGMGEIAIGLHAQTATEDRNGAPAPASICLSVADTGHGMDEATRRRIFDPFFTTKPVGEGTGLGLSVVHGIVTAHGGQIAVASAPGKGTRFDIHFPIHSAVDARPPAAPTHEHSVAA